MRRFIERDQGAAMQDRKRDRARDQKPRRHLALRGGTPRGNRTTPRANTTYGTAHATRKRKPLWHCVATHQVAQRHNNECNRNTGDSWTMTRTSETKPKQQEHESSMALTCSNVGHWLAFRQVLAHATSRMLRTITRCDDNMDQRLRQQWQS